MGLIVLDAGVLIGALDRNAAHHASAVEALRRLFDAGDRLVVPASVYAEVLVGPFRRDEDAAAEVDAFLADLAADVAPATRDIARSAARLRAVHGAKLRLPDALVVATGMALRVDRVVTTDARWPAELPVQVELI